MAKKLIKSEKLQRQVERLEKRFEAGAEEGREEKNQGMHSAAQTERKSAEAGS